MYQPPFVPTEKYFELDVPHYIQLNNTGGQGARECNMVSHTMVVDYILNGYVSDKSKSLGYREPEDYYATLMDGDTTDHSVHTRALEKLGIKSYFSYNTNLDELAHCLRKGFPVVIGCAYKGSGHMVVANGIREGGINVLCPNGIRAGSQNWWYERFYTDAQAKPDLFTWELAKLIFTPNHADDGWARIITEVHGEKTCLHPDILGKRI